MAEKEIKRVIQIDTATGTKSVKDLKKEISDLRDALLNTEKGSTDWQETTKRLVEAQTELKDVMNAGKQAVDASADSIVGMQNKYKSLYDTYKLLTEEQRKSPFGKDMAKQLNELSTKLNTTKKDVGNFKDNIGRYSESMVDAFGKLGMSVGGLTNPIKAVNAGFNLLKANPIMAVLALLVGLFVKVKDAIKGNEELQMRMNKVMAEFKPIGDAVALVLDRIANVAVSVAEGLAKVVGWVTSLFNKTKELADSERELVDIENSLITKRREYGELNAEEEARIAELREQASLVEDMVEKEKLLKEAKELQIKVNERNVELAELEYEAIKKKNEITPSSTEDLNKESEALQKVNQERKKGEDALKKLNAGIKTATNSSIAGLGKIKEEYEELRNALAGGKQTSELELSLLPFPSKAFYDKKISDAETALSTLTDAINKSLGTDLPNKNPFASYEAALNIFGKLSEKELTKLAKLIKSATGTDLIGKDAKTIAAFYSKQVMDFRVLNNEAQDFDIQMESLNSELRHQIDLLDTYGKKFDKGAIGDMGDFYSLTGNIQEEEEKLRLLKERGASEKEILEQEIALIKAKIELQKYYNEQEIEIDEQLQENLDITTDGITLGNQLIIESNEAVKRSYDELYMSATDALSSMLESTKSLMETKLKYGELDEREAKKQQKRLLNLEKAMLAVNLATVVGDTAGGIMGIWKAYALEKQANAQTAAGTGIAAAATLAALNSKSLVAAITQTAGLAATGAAQIASITSKSISNIKGMQTDTNGSVSVGAVPQIIDSTPYSYSRTLQTNAEKEEALNTPIFVRVSDIENGIAQSHTRNAEVTF